MKVKRTLKSRENVARKKNAKSSPTMHKAARRILTERTTNVAKKNQNSSSALKCTADPMTCQSSDTNVTNFIIATPIGDYALQACDKGVHMLDHVSDNVNKTTDLCLSPSAAVELRTGSADNAHAQATVEWMHAYFTHGPIPELPVICHLNNASKYTEFQSNIWRALAHKVGFGERVSYAQLAELAGYSATSARAVGTAMRSNPVSVLVPCHRVVRAGGALGHYSGGNKDALKQWLLQHESRDNK